MDHFEQADLHGQTRNFSNFICKLEFRQNYLTHIRTLAVEDQCFLLQKVINPTISLAEMKNETAEMKKNDHFKKGNRQMHKLANMGKWYPEVSVLCH